MFFCRCTQLKNEEDDEVWSVKEATDGDDDPANVIHEQEDTMDVQNHDLEGMSIVFGTRLCTEYMIIMRSTA